MMGGGIGFHCLRDGWAKRPRGETADGATAAGHCPDRDASEKRILPALLASQADGFYSPSKPYKAQGLLKQAQEGDSAQLKFHEK